MNFTTRMLLVIAAWSALCYAMAFSIPPRLLPYYFVRFVAYFLVTLSVVLPLVIELRNRKFWIAYAFTGFAFLIFTLMDGTSNPIAGKISEVIFLLKPVREDQLFVQGEDYVNGTIGRWLATYYVVELHVVILLAVLSGLIWQKTNDQAPLWLAGIWAFSWLFILAMEYTNVGIGRFGFAEFITVFAFISIMPAVAIFEGKMKPFWTAFSLMGCAVSVQLSLTGSFGYATIVRLVLTEYWPNVSMGIAQMLMLVVAPLASVVAGVLIQVIAVRCKASSATQID